jgi:hypothetical protein
MYTRFNGFLRPMQGFKQLHVISQVGAVTATGRPTTTKYSVVGDIVGIISQANQREKEQWKQNGHPITHTIVQRGTKNRAKATDIIIIPGTERNFYVQGVIDPAEIGHFTIYYVEERLDLKLGVYQVENTLIVKFGTTEQERNETMTFE